ncbi:MAG: hypothetical protein HQL51_04490 [Magnetococcales bacterium]|nr:hypothetical protein [Magnetococcales bacterium]
MIAQTASKLRALMGRFSGNVSAGLSKVARRLEEEVLYGVAARQSVRLKALACNVKRFLRYSCAQLLEKSPEMAQKAALKGRNPLILR